MLCTLAKTGGVPAPSTLIGHDPTISSRSYAALFPEYTNFRSDACSFSASHRLVQDGA